MFHTAFTNCTGSPLGTVADGGVVFEDLASGAIAVIHVGAASGASLTRPALVSIVLVGGGGGADDARFRRSGRDTRTLSSVESFPLSWINREHMGACTRTTHPRWSSSFSSHRRHDPSVIDRGARERAEPSHTRSDVHPRREHDTLLAPFVQRTESRAECRRARAEREDPPNERRD